MQVQSRPSDQAIYCYGQKPVNKIIHEFMIDARGEFKSNELRMFLKELGINILTSVPHMHQQNGRAKRFIRTIVEKAQAIRLEVYHKTGGSLL
jgi:transposase InsO family protein